jgi:hypothetical protein
MVGTYISRDCSLGLVTDQRQPNVCQDTRLCNTVAISEAVGNQLHRVAEPAGVGSHAQWWRCLLQLWGALWAQSTPQASTGGGAGSTCVFCRPEESVWGSFLQAFALFYFHLVSPY